MTDKIKTAVIGGGPGGYVCAIRAAQLGMEVTCFEEWVDGDGKMLLGGTCLNVGCIPSKALLESSEKYHVAMHDFKKHGMQFKDLEIDTNAMQKRKEGIVQSFTKGVEGLLKNNGVTVVAGKARLEANKTISVEGSDNNYGPFDNVVLATGSVPVELKNVAPFDGEKIVDSTGALNFTSPPKTLGIIGAGVIGLELGSVWARLGSKVIIWEALKDFLPMCDNTISKAALKEFKAQGLDIRLNSIVSQTKIEDGRVTVTIKDNPTTELVDALVVAVGRRANSANLLADDCGLAAEANGIIHVDEYCQTKIPGVWAIGDLVRGPMLAHKASHEGIVVAERIAGQESHCDLSIMPSVIYTHPEVSWVGKTEQELKKDGIDYKIGSFPFAALGRAAAAGSSVGMVKLISDVQSGRILGIHIFGIHSSELLATAVTAIEFEANAEDLAMTITAHPTLSESLHEAALDASSGAIHVFRKR